MLAVGKIFLHFFAFDLLVDMMKGGPLMRSL